MVVPSSKCNAPKLAVTPVKSLNDCIFQSNRLRTNITRAPESNLNASVYDVPPISCVIKDSCTRSPESSLISISDDIGGCAR